MRAGFLALTVPAWERGIGAFQARPLALFADRALEKILTSALGGGLESEVIEAVVQQNLGAAIRVAYFLGAAGVLCCGRNSAPLSPAVSKASAGALEWLPIHACSSMPRTLSRAAEAGWHVIGALHTLSKPPSITCSACKGVIAKEQICLGRPVDLGV